MSLKSFVAQSNVPAPLIRAVVRQVGGWSEFKDLAGDVAAYGADGGWSGFTYNADTVAFAKRQKGNILEMAKELASDLGCGSVYEMIGSFSCLADYSGIEVAEAIHNPRSQDRTAVFNALAWYALEETARSYVDLCESN